MRLTVYLAGEWSLEVRQGPESLECRVLWPEKPGPWREVESVDARLGKPLRIIWPVGRPLRLHSSVPRYRWLESESVVERIVCATSGDDLTGAYAGAS